MLLREIGLIVLYLYGVVSVETCPSQRYGPDCNFSCHCLNGDDCDRDSGKCPDDCDAGHLGSGCRQKTKYHTREPGSVMKHSGNMRPEHYSELGYDGYTFPCSKTELRSSNPYWKVWRPYTLQFTGITILTEMGAQGNFSKFTVYVQNETAANQKSGDMPTQSEICVEYTGPTPTSTTINAPCTKPLYGNQIRIQLDNTDVQLVLCEVSRHGACTTQQWGPKCEQQCFCFGKVGCDIATGRCPNTYGCDKGYQHTEKCNTPCGQGRYGYACNSSCSEHCKQRMQCSKIDGSCTDGCAVGWRGTKCLKKCNRGTYGDGCRETCSVNCKDPTNCNNVDGRCANGCARGWRPDKCDQKCDQGTYGDGCSETCSANCKYPGNCDKVNGTCANGCAPGWRSYKCDQKCYPGTYGDGCRETCSVKCKDPRNCHNVYGRCENGCAPGWQADKCDRECYQGTYGDGCSETCSANCNDPNNCDKVNGRCANGCAPGWRSDKCDQKCNRGTYGDGCRKRCSANCKDPRNCDNAHGQCTNGCKPGWQADTCDQKCNNGTYGDRCSKTCSANCKYPKNCRNVNGQCVNGCLPGWKSAKCDQQCDRGTYGDGCRQRCSDNCKYPRNCDNVHGQCTNGCKPGWQADKCNQTCSQGSYGYACNASCSEHCKWTMRCRKTDGRCDGGCAVGWRGDKCLKKCNRGTYGDGCSTNCNANCKDPRNCDNVHGTCTNGCKPGWQADKCDIACPNGTFGINCASNCSQHCASEGYCNKTDGSCKSCKAGWEGSMCGNECTDGKYGPNCKQSCSRHCSSIAQCNKSDGRCPMCVAGWTGNFCNEECSVGRFGVNCRRHCSMNCYDITQCDKIDGRCTSCKPGWQGENCTTGCGDGTYGYECKYHCSGHCNNMSHCNKTDGRCPSCIAGWHGETCTTACPNGTFGVNCTSTCSQHCANEEYCNPTDGSCEPCKAGWEGTMCNNVAESAASSGGQVEGVAGGASVAVLVVLVLVVLVVVLLNKRRKNNLRENRDNDSQRQEMMPPVHNNADIGEANHSQQLEDVNVYYNIGASTRNTDDRDGISDPNLPNGETSDIAIPPRLPKHAVWLDDLRSYIVTHAVEKDALSKQFADIPYGPIHPMIVAQTQINRPKNRYKDMYAYDHSRVILKTLLRTPESDYINACFIKGYKKEEAYIAAQGPTDINIVDFWRMIWEKNVQQVVMLTNLFEMGKMKCKQYWGDPQMTFGSLTVTTESEEVFAEYTRRQLLVTSATENKSRTVQHFHFTAWPDKSTPDGTAGLIHFLHRVRAVDEWKSRPWLVHCSAGVGRTGAFIALDYLYDQGISCQYVNVYQCVHDLRQQRINMVQTKGQYSYVHVIVHDALVLPCKPIKSFDYMVHYSRLLESYKTTLKSKLWMNYQRLQEQDIDLKVVLPNCNADKDDDSVQIATLPENMEKNRYSDIIPSNLHRPLISSSTSGVSNYINAVYLPSYCSSRGYIITQTPLANTRVDWCRLVHEREIETIVTFDDHGIEKIGRCLPPDHGTLAIPPFRVKFVKGDKAKDYTVKTFRMSLENKEKDHTMTEVRFRKWSAGEVVPKDPDSLYNLLQAVVDLQNKNTNRLVLVQCLNGAQRSGLFCVMMNVLEQIRFDDEVAIGHLIRQARLRRQQIVPNFEQFKFCHDVLEVYQQKSSLYANI